MLKAIQHTLAQGAGTDDLQHARKQGGPHGCRCGLDHHRDALCVAMAHAEKRVGVAWMKVQYRAKDA